MTQELWKQIEELYCAAVDCEPAQWEALLAGSSPDVREAVKNMLELPTENNILDQPLWFIEEHPEPSLSLKAGTELGPYKIQGLLGEGGMSSVYRAADSRLNRDVAIKILPHALTLDRNRMRRFEQEARAAGSLNHPNILTVHDVGSHEGTFYLVAELLEGETLRDRIGRGKISREKALGYARMIAAGLIAAHGKGITHRDLKPENLFLTRDGRLKILDFGLAKFNLPEESAVLAEPASPDAQSSKSHPGMLVGTVGYMSPEQAQTRPVDPRSDLFNLGIVLYEMLSGRRPFTGETPIETLHSILMEDPPLDTISETDPSLARFLRHCLEKDPADRFQSAKDLAFDLDGLDAAHAVPAPRSRLFLYAAGSIIAAAALVLITYRAASSSGRSPSFHQITYRTGMITTARFTPDGNTIVYSASWDGNPLETFTTGTSGPESRPLGVPAAGIAGISSTGELALMLGCEINWGECRGTLARMPLAGGAPREVLQGVDYADWDARGEVAVVRFFDGHERVEYPVGHVLYESPEGWISHLRFSPKGDHLAFLHHPRLGNNDGSVDVIDLQGHRKTLVAGRKGLKGLAWAPGGDEVWYSGSDARSPVLRALTLAGKERTVLETPGWSEILDIARDGRVLLLRQNPRTRIMYDSSRAPAQRALSWFDWSTTADLSADGESILFYEWGQAAGGVPTAYIRNTAGGEAVRLGEGKPLAFSPDLRWVLATKSSPTPELILLPRGPGEVKHLPNSGMTAFYSGAWFPDGKRILFVGEGANKALRTYVQSIDGGAAQAIAPEGIRVALISHDGRHLAAYGANGTSYLVDVADGGLHPIRGLEPGDALVQWSRDGHSLYVRADEESRMNLFRVDLATGVRTPWRVLSLPDTIGFIGFENGAGATRITPDGVVTVYTYWQARGELYLAEGLR
jgi:serine/threonine protein kinase/Tol biopolymer transport system component